jgi:hypothetical protein
VQFEDLAIDIDIFTFSGRFAEEADLIRNNPKTLGKNQMNVRNPIQTGKALRSLPSWPGRFCGLRGLEKCQPPISFETNQSLVEKDLLHS